MSVFDNRNLNQDEKNSLKVVIDDTVECLQQIKDLQEHMKENIDGICAKLNENVDDKSMHIKPKLVTKMAKTKMKEDILAQKDQLSDVEIGLELIGN
jgi:hypothetical protein